MIDSIVRITDPSLCVGCRFASSTVIRLKDGRTKPMFQCKRLDCDNWELQPAGTYPKFTDLGQANG